MRNQECERSYKLKIQAFNTSIAFWFHMSSNYVWVRAPKLTNFFLARNTENDITRVLERRIKQHFPKTTRMALLVIDNHTQKI